MAVGRRLKLTLPILVGINFLHKIDPKLFGIFNFLNPKTYGKPIFGHSAAMASENKRKKEEEEQSNPAGLPD